MSRARIPREELASPVQGGPCINCTAMISYGEPASVHVTRGNEWLFKRIESWSRPAKINADHHKTTGWRLKVNGLAPSTIAPYLCGGCNVEISQSIRKAQGEVRKAEHQYAARIIHGQRKTTVARRFYYLKQYIADGDAENLQALSYHQFLNTSYWETVRDKAKELAGYRCQLCNADNRLNVHHRTYEHHGYEHLHLGDLIVLCRNCHAKFHDKLAASA